MPHRKGSCFHIAPIGVPGSPTRMQSDMALDYIVRPALDELYVIKRADEEALPGQISPQVIRDIDEADLVVCDLTDLNPNVMYELGFAHSRGKRVIQIADSGTTLPFDLAQFRTIFFEWLDPKSHQRARADIQKAEEMLRAARRISNLITDSIDYLTLDDIRNGDGGYGGQFDDLKARVDQLERERSRAPDVVGETIDRAEEVLRRAQLSPRKVRGSRQAEAAGEVIALLAGREGFERVAVDRTNEQRVIIYGDTSLDISEIHTLIDGFDIDLRLQRRSA